MVGSQRDTELTPTMETARSLEGRADSLVREAQELRRVAFQHRVAELLDFRTIYFNCSWVCCGLIREELPSSDDDGEKVWRKWWDLKAVEPPGAPKQSSIQDLLRRHSGTVGLDEDDDDFDLCFEDEEMHLHVDIGCDLKWLVGDFNMDMDWGSLQTVRDELETELKSLEDVLNSLRECPSDADTSGT